MHRGKHANTNKETERRTDKKRANNNNNNNFLHYKNS